MIDFAITRKPGKNFSKGLTTQKLGKPSYEKVIEQHKNYCNALKKCGLKVIILEPEESFPDCPFVEDTAIVTKKCAIITRLGDDTRKGEEAKIKEILSKHRKIENINAPGTVDAGDILRIENKFFIGVSKRTDENGANQLSSILKKYGYESVKIHVKNVLHLKTGITYIGNNTVVLTEEFSNIKEFKDFKKIVVDAKESYAANCLLINNTLLIPKGFKKLKEKLKDYKIIEVEMSEFRKMDGGLTCLSILF